MINNINKQWALLSTERCSLGYNDGPHLLHTGSLCCLLCPGSLEELYLTFALRESLFIFAACYSHWACREHRGREAEDREWGWQCGLCHSSLNITPPTPQHNLATTGDTRITFCNEKVTVKNWLTKPVLGKFWNITCVLQIVFFSFT